MVISLAFLYWDFLALGILARSIIVDQDICNVSIVKMTYKKFHDIWFGILALQHFGVKAFGVSAFWCLAIK
jgi:hypothetical protein